MVELITKTGMMKLRQVLSKFLIEGEQNVS